MVLEGMLKRNCERLWEQHDTEVFRLYSAECLFTHLCWVSRGFYSLNTCSSFWKLYLAKRLTFIVRLMVGSLCHIKQLCCDSSGCGFERCSMMPSPCRRPRIDVPMAARLRPTCMRTWRRGSCPTTRHLRALNAVAYLKNHHNTRSWSGEPS